MGFDQVKFEYPGRPGIPILRGLCLEVAAGSMVALVGESGSGKSTVIQLALRFYDPDEGTTLNFPFSRPSPHLYYKERILLWCFCH